jgi:hypothetical protein
MTTIECPFCAGEATTDDGLTSMACESCGVTVEVAADAPAMLEAAA